MDSQHGKLGIWNTRRSFHMSEDGSPEPPSSPQWVQNKTAAMEGEKKEGRMTAEEMDSKRKENVAYEYLCHLEEAKVWIEACINESLPPTTELEEGLTNGVFLAKLAHFFAPEVVSLKKIYDKDQTRYKSRGLHFRHTDNINHFLKGMEHIGFPTRFHPETTDIYDRKNMPRVIYCVHGLSLFLFKLGIAPQIQDLYGKINFTEEEISAMRKELEKYGIQMPAFSKIGGVLTNEMPVDEAALHAAVIAINEAIENQEPEDTLTSLSNKEAHLVNILPEYADKYQSILFEAKHTKAESSRNKSIDPDAYEPDVYDELLTQAEIQGNVNKVNTLQALEDVNNALEKDDRVAVVKAMKSKLLGLKNISDENADFYYKQLQQERQNKQNNNIDDENPILDKDELQSAVNEANISADTEVQKSQAVFAINRALEDGDPTTTVKALKNPAAQLPVVYDFASSLYQEEFFMIKNEKKADLAFNELHGGVRVLSAIAKINEAVEAGSSSAMFKALQDPFTHIEGLDEINQEKYLVKLQEGRVEKIGETCDLLNHMEIQEYIDMVNGFVKEENDKVNAIGVINEAVDRGNPVGTLECLQVPQANLKDVDPKNASLYQKLLAEKKSEKAKEHQDDTTVLWLDEIQNMIKKANDDRAEAERMSVCVAAVNLAIDQEDSQQVMQLLTSKDISLSEVNSKCADAYLKELLEARAQKSTRGECGSGWVMNRTKHGHKFYFNVVTLESGWEKPANVVKDHSLLTRDEVQTIVGDVTEKFNHEAILSASEPFIIQLQAFSRGYLARRKVIKRLEYLEEQQSSIVLIQSAWKGSKQRHKYKERKEYLADHIPEIIRIQSWFRMWKARKEYLARLRYFRQNVDSIIKIQAFMRSNKARNDFRTLMYESDPPVNVMRKFVHLLDHSDVDYSEEMELTKLRQNVVTEIRSNHKLEEDLNQMDIKIGLLVKNRITLQDVLTHNNKLGDYQNKMQTSTGGLKGLSKESREKLEAYQHLFYLLQTNPTYLAKLIFEMPLSKTTVFMESVILALYNYASNHREEFLLLKLFKTALEEEISSKVEKMSDITTGNPLVVKMTVDFNRNGRGQSSLREILNPLVLEVIQNKEMKINTNPTEIYKSWVNQLESETGRASGMPYDVTIEQALKHQPVRDKIEKNIQELKYATDRFFCAILKSLDKIPYGMRYIAKVMKNALHVKFPEAPEKDVLKIVGNLLYYRYINSAIVAPDAFDIITVGANNGLTNDQRRNLGSIAKILQFAASNKGYGGESEYLACLNPYIRDAHERFKQFFRAACDVEEPEIHFNIDQYTDFCLVSKPTIYISIKEIVDTHQLLMEHQDTIAPDHNDPLHELLEDLGEAPDIGLLVGEHGEHSDAERRDILSRTEIMLTLSNKFEVQEDEKKDQKNMLIRTKRMVVDVVRCQQGETLTEILQKPATDAQEDFHQALIKSRERTGQRADQKSAEKTNLLRDKSLLSDTMLPLETMKKKILSNLQNLELFGITTRKNDYQSVVNAIVQDIRNQRIYRARRRQEMVKLKSTLNSLNSKRAFYEEQIDYYNQYVKTCLGNLAKNQRKPRTKSWFGKESEGKAKNIALKYNAMKLYEKGIILEIDGLPENQFKNLLFEINSTHEPGIFEVHASFMGVEMDKVKVVLQDLLQLQYEGVAVYRMFNRTKVNVNLLIFLLNTKFFGK
ncbi:ras GTPase-activating-like protein IQGAP1 isoform X2 [Lineus longissimus]|uniref:ras GTPase-activating-like protein IQGAP1 isoform X2 n=1 Tax=Lineus longissimus TaxID=88925 RepID=UPI002B4E8C28